MPIKTSIDTSDLRALSRALKQIDPALARQVGKDIKSAVRPTADRILKRIPTDLGTSGNFRGFGHSGRTAWGRPRVGVYATPGGGKGSIARIEIYGTGDRKAAFKLADLAGTRNSGDRYRREHYRQGGAGRRGGMVRGGPTRSGDVLIRKLQNKYPLSAGGRGGRFAWQNFMKERPFLIDKTVDIINDYVDTVNRKGLRR